MSLSNAYSDEHRPLAACGLLTAAFGAGTFAAYALADALQMAHVEAMPS